MIKMSETQTKDKLECYGKLLDATIRSKKRKIGKRYYIHIQNPEVVEDSKFPFKPGEIFVVRVKTNKVELLKLVAGE